MLVSSAQFRSKFQSCCSTGSGMIVAELENNVRKQCWSPRRGLRASFKDVAEQVLGCSLIVPSALFLPMSSPAKKPQESLGSKGVRKSYVS